MPSISKRQFITFEQEGGSEDDLSMSSESDAFTDTEQHSIPTGGKKALLNRNKKVKMTELPEEEESTEPKTIASTASNSNTMNTTNSNTNAVYKNKQRVLVVCSRGITFRFRHLMNDLHSLLPHSKKDSKLDMKSNLNALNELCELNNCNNCLFFEIRKHTDLFMWLSKTPNGPSAKFYLQNIHTMDELKLTGNCLKGSRPLLSFDAGFDSAPHWKIVKELLTQASFFLSTYISIYIDIYRY
jgi:hypothetical protein